MAQFDANINLRLNAEQVERDLKKIEDRVQKLNAKVESVNKRNKGPASNLITGRQADAAREVEKLERQRLKTIKNQIKIKDAQVEKEIRLAAAQQRQLTILKALERAGGAADDAAKDRIRDVLAASKEAQKNLGIQNSTNTLLEKELQIRREINRLANAADIARVGGRARGARIDQIKRSGAFDTNQIKKLASLNEKYINAAVAGQADIARAVDRRVKKELDGIEKIIKARQAAGGPVSPIDGSTSIPGSPKFLAAKKKARSDRFESLALGAGFPLLFGGGAGSVLGSIAGSFVGSGFGGQILGGAIGQAIDNFVQSIAEAGQALDAFSGDVEKIGELTGTAGNQSIKYAQALEELGLKQSALQIATQQAAEVIGTQGVGALQLFAEDTKRLSEATARVGLKIQAFFAQALGGFTNLIAQIIEKLGGAKPEDTGNAPAKALIKNQVEKFNTEEIEILRQEYEIKKLINAEDQKIKQVAEAKLAISKLDLEIKKERSKAAMAQMNEDIVGEAQAKNAEFLLKKKRNILELELSQAEAAKRVYDQYTQQADALQQVVTVAKLRLNAEQAVADGRSKLTDAFYSAELKLNELAIQRAKQKGDTNKVLQLELRQVELIYRQTVAQIQAEVERTRLKARQVELATKELQVAQLRKQAEGKSLNQADIAAMEVQKQALAIARYNVQVSEKVAEQQIRGAQAVYTASREALIYANNQNKVANAAERTANAQARGANAVARAAKSAGNWGSNAPWGLGPGQVRGGFVQDFRRTARYGGMTKAQQDYTQRMIKAGLLSSTRIGAPKYKKPLIGARGYAEGGYVTRPTQALVGERGENEYVIPESKMSSALGRYARGDRGDSVVQGATNAEGKSGGRAVVNVNTGPVMRMNNKDYVTVNDMNSALGSVVSAMSPSGGNYNSSARLG